MEKRKYAELHLNYLFIGYLIFYIPDSVTKNN